jgi:putative PIN family toxin of toxin-antitoxin system
VDYSAKIQNRPQFLSNEILEEYAEILNRLAGKTTAELVLNTIIECKNVVFLTPYYHFNLITSDPDDNKFVDCAIQANARYIVTNDHHYDVLRQIEFPKVGIIKLTDFLQLMHE